MFFGNTWRRWELDQLIRDEDVRVDAWPAVRRGLRYLLRTMFCEDTQTLYLFYHEEDDVVWSVLWQATSGSDGTWYEALPICGEVGRRLLRELRRSPARRRRQYGAVLGGGLLRLAGPAGNSGVGIAARLGGAIVSIARAATSAAVYAGVPRL